MKRDRQAVIKQMISRDKIGTQEEIKQRLEAEYSFYTYKSSDKSYQNFNISDNTFCRFVRYKPILHPLWKKSWHTHRTADGPSCPQTAEGNSPFPPCGSGSLSCRIPDRFRHIW